MVLLRRSMRSPRPEFRAQPAGHACGPPLRDAAARTARRTRQRRRRNHPPGPAAGRGAPVGASRPRVQGRFFTSFRMTKRRGATQCNRIANIRPSFRDGTTSGRRQKKAPPKKESRGKKQAKNPNKPQASKNHKKESKNIRQSPPRTPPESKKSATKKREPPNGDSLKNAAERPIRSSDRK